MAKSRITVSKVFYGAEPIETLEPNLVAILLLHLRTKVEAGPGPAADPLSDPVSSDVSSDVSSEAGPAEQLDQKTSSSG